MWRKVMQALGISLLFAVLGFALVFWLGKVKLEQVLLIRKLPLISLLWASLALLLSYVLAALRLQYYCKLLKHKLAFRHAIRTHILGMFSAAVTPSGSGSAPAIALTLQYQGLSSGQSWATGIALFVADAFFLVWSLPLALIFLRWHGLYPSTPLATFVAVMSVLITGLITYLLVYRLNWLAPICHWLFKGKLKRFHKSSLRFVNSLLESNTYFTGATWRFYALGQVYTSLSWLAFFQILTLLASGLGISVPIVASSAWQTATTAISFAVPTPGGSGFFEVGTSFLLLGRGHDDVVPAILLCWRFMTFYLSFILGPILGGYILLKTLSSHEHHG